MDVHVLRVGLEPVTRALEDDQVGGQASAQPGHVRLHRAHGSSGRVIAILAGDDLLHADHPPRVQQQHHQQRARSGPTDANRLPGGGPYLQRPEDPELHGSMLHWPPHGQVRCGWS